MSRKRLQDVHGFVLAAGLGTRLKPFTDHTPKPLLPFFDVPLVEHTIRRLLDAGVTRLTVNLFHLGDVLRQFLEKLSQRLPKGVRIDFSPETVLMGTGGGLAKAACGFDGATTLVVNGDVWCNPDLDELLDVHVGTGAEATALLHSGVGRDELLTTSVDREGRIVSIVPGGDGGRGPGRSPPAVFSGVYLVEPQFYARLPLRPCSVISEGFLPAIARGARVHGLIRTFAWHDLGTWGDVLAAHMAVLGSGDGGPYEPARRLAPGEFRAAGTGTVCVLESGDGGPYEPARRLAPGEFRAAGTEAVYVGPGALVEAGAEVGPGVVLGAGSVVGAGTRVRRSVVLPGCTATGTVVGTVVFAETAWPDRTKGVGNRS